MGAETLGNLAEKYGSNGYCCLPLCINLASVSKHVQARRAAPYRRARSAHMRVLPTWMAGWLTSWLASWLAGWLSGRLAGYLEGWQAVWLAEWLSSWLASWVAARWLVNKLADRLTNWLAGIPRRTSTRAPGKLKIGFRLDASKKCLACERLLKKSKCFWRGICARAWQTVWKAVQNSEGGPTRVRDASRKSETRSRQDNDCLGRKKNIDFLRVVLLFAKIISQKKR